MPLMLVGLTQKDAEVAPDAAPHLRIDCRDWIAIALELKPDAMADEDQALSVAMRQNAVLTTYSGTLDVIPIPLGAVFSGQGPIAEYVEVHHTHFREEMRRLTGLCEYSLQIRKSEGLTPENPSAAETGRAFLQSRRRLHASKGYRRREQMQFARSVEGFLKDRCNDIRPLKSNNADCVAHSAILIRRTASDEIITALARTSEPAAPLGLTCKLIGPSPAYSFIQTEAANAA